MDRFIGGIEQKKYILFGCYKGSKEEGKYPSVVRLQEQFGLLDLKNVVYIDDDGTGVIIGRNGVKVAMNEAYAREWMSNVQYPRLIMSGEKMGVSDLVDKVRKSHIIPVHLQHSIEI